jgi:hypothetical protein
MRCAHRNDETSPCVARTWAFCTRRAGSSNRSRVNPAGVRAAAPHPDPLPVLRTGRGGIRRVLGATGGEVGPAAARFYLAEHCAGGRAGECAPQRRPRASVKLRKWPPSKMAGQVSVAPPGLAVVQAGRMRQRGSPPWVPSQRSDGSALFCRSATFFSSAPIDLGLMRLKFRLKRGDQRREDADVGFQSVDAWVGHVFRAPWHPSITT